MRFRIPFLPLAILITMGIIMSASAKEPICATVAAGPHPVGVLIDKGVAHATLVVPASAGPVELYAARDAQNVFHQMTGITLPIARDNEPIEGNRILIGATRFTDAVVPSTERADLGKEGYIARLKGRDLVLAGNGPYASMYALDELYDRLGARWYMPGELGACVPKLETIRFDSLDVKRKPSFKMRDVGADTEWNLHNRLNHIEDKTLPPGFLVYPGIYHTQNTILPREIYTKTHPEYYALVDGKRAVDIPSAKLCNSNPDLARELARNMAEMLRKTPGIDLIALSPNDNNRSWCECDACRALDDASVDPNGAAVPKDQTYSRRQMVLCNRVAEELGKDFPNQTMLVGAYSTYSQPPRDPSIRASTNLAVIICHSWPEAACLAHPVNDPDCTPNARYLELIRSWKQQTPHIYVYEYYWKVNWLDLPWPIAHTVAADIPFYKSLGIEGLHTQHRTGSIWSEFIPMYIAARMLWDSSLDPKALVDELYGKFYGEAAEPMRRWHEILEQKMAMTTEHILGDAVNNSPVLFTEDVVDALKRNVSEAQRLATDDLVKRRIEKIALLTEYTDRLTQAFRLNEASEAAKNPEKRLELLKQAYLIADSLRDDLVAGHYKDVVTGRLSVKNRTLHKWREILVKANLLDSDKYPDKGGAGTPWDII